MPRTRDRKNANLPDGVYIHRDKYVYRPYLGRKDGKSLFGERIVIGPDTLPLSQIYAFMESMEEGGDVTLGVLLDEFVKSDEFKEKTADYQYTKSLYAEKIKNARDRKGKYYGDMSLEDIQTVDMTQLLKDIGASRGHTRKTLIAAWDWGMTAIRDMPEVSPMDKVKKEKRGSRVENYVTDEEYEAVYALADPYWKVLMEFAYICRARRSEITKMHRDQLLEVGVELRRSKGSWDEITLWTPRLKNALAMLDELNGGVQYENVFGAPNIYKGKGTRPVPGSIVSKNTLDTQWQNLVKKAKAKGAMKKDWCFHDLKGKGVTDHKELISGHKTLSAKLVYVRKSMQVEGTR